MKAATLLVACASSCAFVGTISQRSIEAGGVIATSSLATPVVGFFSWPIWKWIADFCSSWISGTTEVRVVEQNSTAPGPQLVEQFSLLGQIENNMLIALAIVAFIALGGPAWVSSKLQKARKEDAEWTSKYNEDRAKDLAEVASLKAKIELLEKMIAPKP